MSQAEFLVGDMVVLSTEEWQGKCAIVSQPISTGRNGHVLVHLEGHIIGVNVAVHEVNSADEKTKGFAQLAYNLIKLGSYVIERSLL